MDMADPIAARIEFNRPDPHVRDFHGFRLIRWDGRQDEPFDDFVVTGGGAQALEWLNEQSEAENNPTPKDAST